MQDLKLRLINLSGDTVADTSIELDAEHPGAIIFSDRVFIYAFTVGAWQHFREVKAARVRFVETARTSLTLNTPEEKKHNDKAS